MIRVISNSNVEVLIQFAAVFLNALIGATEEKYFFVGEGGNPGNYSSPQQLLSN